MDIIFSIPSETSFNFDDNTFLITNLAVSEKPIRVPRWTQDDYDNLSLLIGNPLSLSRIMPIIQDQPFVRQIKFRSIINFLFANRLANLAILDNDLELIAIRPTHKQAVCISNKTLQVENLGKINKTTTIRINSDQKLLFEDTHSFCSFSFNCDNNEILFLFVQILKNSDISSVGIVHRVFVDQLKYLMALNNFYSQDSDSAIKYWEYHELVFDAMTRMYDDHYVRSGDYRFLPKECEVKANLAVNTQPDDFHLLHLGLPPISQRITVDNSRVISDSDLINLYRRSFLNLRAEENNIAVTGTKYPDSITHRPYPSAGNIHELRYFLVSWGGDSSDNVELKEFSSSEGIFLDPYVETKNMMRNLINIQHCWQADNPPRYALIIASEFRIISYKYRNIAYRLTLLNTGCALSSFYRACRSLSIGCCAVGTGLSANIQANTAQSRYELVPTMEVGFGFPD